MTGRRAGRSVRPILAADDSTRATTAGPRGTSSDGAEGAPGLGEVVTRTVRVFDRAGPLRLERGVELAPVDVAYETYGRLDADAGNVVMVCHALTGDAHAAGHHGDPDRPGWWDNLIGPGRPLDTRELFVVCANLLGGCQGTTGPGSTDPATGRPYGLRFPLFSVRDLVTVHRALLARLGIPRLRGAIGGSLGGMQVLQWALDHPGEIGAAMVVAASSRLSAQNIAFSAVARSAITTDPDFLGGDYYGTGRRPERGLAVAHKMAHITYLSDESMRRKFDRRRRLPPDAAPGFEVDFEVEAYLEHQGESFLRRFDANSYLYLTRVMDHFEPFAEAGAGAGLDGSRTHFLVLAFDSDWRFDTRHSRAIVHALRHRDARVTFREIVSPWGHDSFLLPVPAYHAAIADFLAVDRG